MHRRQTPQPSTREFARVVGPYLVIVPGLVILRAHDMNRLLANFVANPVLAWLVGGLLLAAGLIIISRHQQWSSVAAVLISLFGWYLALRGLVLLAAPEPLSRVATAGVDSVVGVRVGFSALPFAGAWLTWVGWCTPPVPASMDA
jgi:hypothetical protein